MIFDAMAFAMLSSYEMQSEILGVLEGALWRLGWEKMRQ